MVTMNAQLSSCGSYRYELARCWDPCAPPLTFIMLNPSTADASADDPTIRRCMGFARREGLGGIVVVNLYAYRATFPVDMLAAADPVGSANDAHLVAALASARRQDAPVVAAWGAKANPDRVRQVCALEGFEGVLCLGVTNAGHPRHPLYVPADTPFTPWPPSGGKP